MLIMNVLKNNIQFSTTKNKEQENELSQKLTPKEHQKA